MSKEQPILMSTPMVQALLNDTKTETRRDKNLKEINENPDEWLLTDFKDGIARFYKPVYLNGSKYPDSQSAQYRNIKCPWQVGNILWCKETWKPTIEINVPKHKAIRYKADGRLLQLPDSELDWFEELTADGRYVWKSSMFMRRKFARIFLRITDIKLERLHDITEEGAKAEGIERERCWGIHYAWKGYGKTCYHAGAVDSYKSLWESINGEGSWNANPWIWCVKFEKLNSYK